MTANATNGFLHYKQEWPNQQLKNPLRILVWNLMPTKANTEEQFLQLLNQVDQDVELTFLYACSHQFKTVRREDVKKCYACLHQIEDQTFDGLIITGAPVEKLEFEDVDYWKEFCQIKDWAEKHVGQTINACWSAQAALYHDFGIQKRGLNQKLFGIFRANTIESKSPLTAGLENFKTPQSRHSESVIDEAHLPENLQVLLTSSEAGPLVLQSLDKKQTYVTGHSEYQTQTLDQEYRRDLAKHTIIHEPKNYYPDGYYDQGEEIENTWQQSSCQLYQNWLNLITTKEKIYD
ncbi:putative homoserine O-succinyltransferase [Fructobacillus pseudoficulneus]|uniref:Homoserine O-acetyltransferase n=1 Tax=Fructobacillus pseudoficulneus TaxID=220714 RepID=A0A3F3GVU5_9LACO|nr:homoserine O-succinyltransferase [Fructobacillus pseudoficulneus]GAP02936.1 putative homoserine O-succinyltransferase [Fructobacillus pseudoficulneus]SEH44975.1 homoserine O-succinyltransferase [Fructobacillus pseudoficulneus]